MWYVAEAVFKCFFLFKDEAHGCQVTSPGDYSDICIPRDKSSPWWDEAVTKTQPVVLQPGQPATKLPRRTTGRRRPPDHLQNHGRWNAALTHFSEADWQTPQYEKHTQCIWSEPGCESLSRALVDPQGNITPHSKRGRIFWNMELDMASWRSRSQQKRRLRYQGHLQREQQLKLVLWQRRLPAPKDSCSLFHSVELLVEGGCPDGTTFPSTSFIRVGPCD